MMTKMNRRMRMTRKWKEDDQNEEEDA